MEERKISIPKLKTLIRKGKIEELLTKLLEVTVGKDELQKNIMITGQATSCKKIQMKNYKFRLIYNVTNLLVLLVE